MNAPNPLNAPRETLQQRFVLDGMSCASCVARVERVLAAQPGVVAARVNLAGATADVRYAAPASAEALAGAMAAAGYPPRREVLRLSVEGMTCASCTGRVERVLRAQPGVIAAAVNLGTRSALVTVWAGSVTAAALAAAVTRAGYAASGKDAPGPDAQAAELAALRRDTIAAAVLTAPVFVAEMGGHLLPAVHHWIAQTVGTQTSWVLQSGLVALVLAGPGRRFFAAGLPALFRGAPDMNSLVAVGTLSAFLYSLVATYAPALLPETARAVYFEAAAVIVLLILLGRLLETRARGRTGAAIARLAGLRPRSARVERAGVETDLPVDEVMPGDILRLRPGERVAVDGEVVDGETWVDEAMLTGEPAPVAKQAGAEVTGGTVNGTGSIRYRATRVGAETTLSRIMAMVEEAQGAKLPIQALVDRITLWFVPAVMVLALLTVVVWLVFGPGPAPALVAGVSVLIIACPCAMGLAVPVSIMVGTGRAAELGVLFRRGEGLQALQGVRWIAFDKTGTLTEGRPRLTDIELAPGQDEATVLAAVAAVEAGSEHPLAHALREAADQRGLAVPVASRFRAIPGHGVEALVGDMQVLVGADRLMAREGIDAGALAVPAARLAAEGRTPMHVAIGGQEVAVLAVADPEKPGAREALDGLRGMGVQLAMITGDARATAEAIARNLGLDRIEAEVLPGGKVAALRALGPGLAFVGDGINDAPALAAADVGIAIGTGTDVAIEAAEVVLMSGDPRGVVTALEISRATMANIRQNLIWAFGYNVALIPVAAGVLVPFGGPQLSPMLAAGAMALSSVFVVSNALRLRRAGTVPQRAATERMEG
jgi:P-type Cu+ transporter